MSPTEKREVLDHLHTEIAAIKEPTDADRLAAWEKLHSEPTFPEDRELTDVDVRHPDDAEHQGMIEFATFCEGEYIESVYIDRDRARELRNQLTSLLSIPPYCGVCGEYHEPRCIGDDLPEPGDIRETGK